MREPIVQCGQVWLRGECFSGGVVFRGVPYAAPPIGPLRFRPPQPLQPWVGVRDARTFGSIARQIATPLEVLNGNDARPQSEDCLTLNVWTPSCDDGVRPVMVWIHGGAFLTGSGATPTFDGSSFARQHDVVTVTLNYRLNVFGFLNLTDLDPAEAGSGNCGLHDQIAALRWVQANIAVFGGDPDNVTVFGESAGAMSVGALLATPSATGLFHRAILQSGAASSALSADAATSVARELMSSLGLSADHHGIAALRATSDADLLSASAQMMQRLSATRAPESAGFFYAPVVDGDVLPDEPLRMIGAGASRDVAVMVGTNRDEMEIMHIQSEVFYGFADDEVRRRFDSVFGSRADAASTFYNDLAAGTPRNPWTAVDSDRNFLMPAVDLAEARWAAGGATWMYLFAWPTTAFGGRFGAYHGLPMVHPTRLATWRRGCITAGPNSRALVTRTTNRSRGGRAMTRLTAPRWCSTRTARSCLIPRRTDGSYGERSPNDEADGGEPGSYGVRSCAR
jgi:para-nitrobenzyl esterase